MGLVRVLQLVSVSSDGTTITIKDTTGVYNSTTNPTGYGTPNPAINNFTSLLTVVGFMDKTTVNLLVTDSTQTQGFLGGSNLGLTSLMAAGFTAAYPFSDGVLKLTSYALYPIGTCSGIAGQNYITGSGLVISDYIADAAYNVYQVDSTKTNTSSLIYLTTTIKAAFTQYYPSFAAVCYALVEVEFICKLTNAIAAMAGSGDEDERSAILMDMLVKKFAADFDFANADYFGADNNIRTGINRLNQLLHG